MKIIVDQMVEYLKEYFQKANIKKAVLGISGGKDSTVVAMLLCKALGNENVIGILMPDGEQKDINDSLEVVNKLNIPYQIINIKPMTQAFSDNLGELTQDAKINIPPRVRMTALYAIAQTNNALVVGTGNLSERTVGYTTKWGDSASDINPLGNLTSLEVVSVGLTLAKEFNLRKSLIEKTPADGLSSLTDEEKLGVTYIEIHNYIRNDIYNERVEKLAKSSEHKRNPIPMFKFKRDE